jgi:hypothetical protein
VDFETVNDLITDIDNCVAKVCACTSIDNCIHTNGLLSLYSNNDSIGLLHNKLVCNYAPSSVICDNSVKFLNENLNL